MGIEASKVPSSLMRTCPSPRGSENIHADAMDPPSKPSPETEKVMLFETMTRPSLSTRSGLPKASRAVNETRSPAPSDTSTREPLTERFSLLLPGPVPPDTSPGRTTGLASASNAGNLGSGPIEPMTDTTDAVSPFARSTEAIAARTVAAVVASPAETAESSRSPSTDSAVATSDGVVPPEPGAVVTGTVAGGTVDFETGTVVLTLPTVDLVDATVVFVVTTVDAVVVAVAGRATVVVVDGGAAMVVVVDVEEVVVVDATVTTIPGPLTTRVVWALPAVSDTENDPEAARLVVPLPPGRMDDVTATVQVDAVDCTTESNEDTLVPVKSAEVTVVQSIGSFADTRKVTVRVDDDDPEADTVTVGGVPSGTAVADSAENGPGPFTFTARTLAVYEVPLASEVTRADVAVETPSVNVVHVPPVHVWMT